MRNNCFPTLFDEFDAFCTALPSGCCKIDRPDIKCEGLSISENDKHFFVDAHLPGVDPKNIDVTITPQEPKLVISGRTNSARGNVNWHLKGASQFHYEIPISNEINIDTKVEAVSRNGVLSVTLTKNKGHKPLKIDIQVD